MSTKGPRGPRVSRLPFFDLSSPFVPFSAYNTVFLCQQRGLHVSRIPSKGRREGGSPFFDPLHRILRSKCQKGIRASPVSRLRVGFQGGVPFSTLNATFLMSDMDSRFRFFLISRLLARFQGEEGGFRFFDSPHRVLSLH